MDLDRRLLLQTGASLTALAALGGCETILDQIRRRPVRKDMATLTSNDPILDTYREAVRLMKALPTSDPRNWTRQAQIHQDFCPHGNWFFFPWHRAYLLSFERICQELTGDGSFGLPYWNWSCNFRIPPPFWAGDLDHSPRTATQSSEANDSIVGNTVIEDYLDETDFAVFAGGKATALRGGGGFSGQIEGSPHNYIHGFVGGTMGTFMSPLDPVFWCHHNVIDYFWYEWNKRGNANTNDPVYADFDIQGQMVNGNGDPVTYNVASLILAPLLSYRFEPPNPCGRLRLDTLEHKWLREFLKRGSSIPFRPSRQFDSVRDVRVVFGDVERVKIALPPEVSSATLSPDSTERLLLRLDNVTPPANEDFFVQVYVGLDDSEDANSQSAAYAGSFAFFNDPEVHHMAYNYIVDLDDALQRQVRGGRIRESQALEVTLIARPVEVDRPVPDRRAIIGTMQPITIPRRSKPVIDEKGVKIDDAPVKLRETR